jgi:hypothetical protein
VNLWYHNRVVSVHMASRSKRTASEKFRLYVHDLEKRCDTSGDVQTIALLREDRDACSAASKNWKRDQ